MFIKEDLYTVTGTTKLYHCWTDKVTKFDSSSFYNWEQDNMPIYDLDERTHYLWEQLGYPTSSIPGVSLVVSADAPDNEIDCNKNIFRTVSAAIEALPKIINYPIVIEIANFGQLGDLILDGLVFGKNGSLEIINRNFAKLESTVSSSADVIFPGIEKLPINTYYYQDPDPSNKYKYVSAAHITVDYDASTIRFSPLVGFKEASCISISAAVFSSTFDSRLSGVGSLSPKLNGYVSIQKPKNNYNRASLIIDDYNTVNPYYEDGSQYNFRWKTFDLNSNAQSENQIYTKDASTINYYTNGDLYLSSGYFPSIFNNEFKTYQGGNGLFYGNKLKKLIVNNCHGKIYLRNFFLDGSGFDATDNFNGVEINNSTVVLENIVSTRYRKAGFKFTNSKITITRGCVATRIYDFDSSGSRISGDISSIRNYYSYDLSTIKSNYDSAAGILADNSVINFSSTYEREYDLYSTQLSTSSAAIPSHYWVFEFVKNANGIILNNSTIIGGKSQDGTKAVASIFESVIDLNHNTGYGLISNNSKISLDGRIRFLENINGVKLINSIFEIDKILCMFNQNFGIESYKSNIIYNKNFDRHMYELAGNPDEIDFYSSPIMFYGNGQHIYLDNSNLEPFYTSSMDDRYCYFDLRHSIKHNGGDYGQSLLPSPYESVKITNNSNAVFISPLFQRTDGISINATNWFTGKKGSELLVTNNSKAKLIGTRNYCTRVIGPGEVIGNFEQGNFVALAADQNSTLEINGPTVVAQYAVDILGDNNSNIIIGPQRLSDDSALDISSINLSNPANHTAVELHSTRACIVVNNNSNLSIKNLGAVETNWITRSGLSKFSDTSAYPDLITYNVSSIPLYTSGGGIQFYPNPVTPQGESYGGTIKGTATVPEVQQNFNSSLVSTRGLWNLRNLATTTQLQFSAVTFGGVCVKAVNNSNVDVFNVNFPCGFWNPSAAYYDGTIDLDSGGACYKTFIWNICDNSQLKAGLLSVSGLYPRLAGYTGPYGFWASSTSAAAYGAPSSTPDTSSLSVLDYYGANPSGTAYSVSSAKNYGPFRLYFSVNPIANSLVDVSGNGNGIIPQIYSQGYQPSGNLVCSSPTFVDNDPSSLYMMAWQRNVTTNVISPSGYYYGKDVVNDPYFQRVLLDESASEVFANAKHCAVGKSNNAKPVAIYYPYIEQPNGDSANNLGVGSLSMFSIERNS